MSKWALIGISENWRHEPIRYHNNKEDAENDYFDSVHDWTHEDVIKIENDSTAEPISDIIISKNNKVIFASYWGAIEYRKNKSNILHCTGYLDINGEIETQYDYCPYPKKYSTVLDITFVLDTDKKIISYTYENSLDEIKKITVEEFLNSYLDELIKELTTAKKW